MKTQKNRCRYLLFLIIVVLILSGCSDMTQIEDRDFVLAIGIGFEDGNYKVTYARPDLSALTGQPVGKNEKFVSTYTGLTLSDIEEDYARNSDKRLDLRHLKVIVLDSSLVDNKVKMDELLGFIENKYEISRNTLVFYTKDQSNKILEVNTISGNVGENVEQLYENNPENSDAKKVTIGDLINGKYQVQKVVVMPNLEIKKDRIWLSGAAIFSENEYVDSVDENQLTYINMLNGMGKGRDIVIENSQIIKIKDIKSKFTFTLKDKKPYVLIKITGEGEELQSNTPGDTKTIFEAHVNDAMLYLYENLMKDKNVDFLNLYRKTSYKDRRMWEMYQGKFDQFMDDLSVVILVDFTLQNIS